VRSGRPPKYSIPSDLATGSRRFQVGPGLLRRPLRHDLCRRFFDFAALQKRGGLRDRVQARYLRQQFRRAAQLFPFRRGRPICRLDPNLFEQSLWHHHVGGLLTACTTGCGTVFKLDTSGSNFAVLHNFSITDGSNPSAGLILDPSGNLYGTTAYGGSANQGTVFKIPAAGGTLTVLHNFGDGTVANDGAVPFAGLILDASGSLYGTTNLGGSSGVGTMFELATTLRGTTQIIVNQANAIIDQVNALYAKSQLNFGQDNSLVEHLQQALSLVKKRKNAGAIQTLQGFIYEVGGLQSSNVLTSSQAGPLITEADVIVAELR